MAKKSHLWNLGAIASCVMRTMDVGQKIFTFNDSSFFRKGVHDDLAMPKEPTLDNKSSTSSSESSTEINGLLQKPPAVNVDHLSQVARAEEDQHVSIEVQNV